MNLAQERSIRQFVGWEIEFLRASDGRKFSGIIRWLEIVPVSERCFRIHFTFEEPAMSRGLGPWGEATESAISEWNELTLTARQLGYIWNLFSLRKKEILKLPGRSILITLSPPSAEMLRS